MSGYISDKIMGEFGQLEKRHLPCPYCGTYINQPGKVKTVLRCSCGKLMMFVFNRRCKHGA